MKGKSQMDDKRKWNREDAVFFMDMVGSARSPNDKHEYFQRKPYYKILERRDSVEFVRFSDIYRSLSPVLSERERRILNGLYGVDEERVATKKIAEQWGVTPGRIRQLRNKAEIKLVTKILS